MYCAMTHLVPCSPKFRKKKSFYILMGPPSDVEYQIHRSSGPEQ